MSLMKSNDPPLQSLGSILGFGVGDEKVTVWIKIGEGRQSGLGGHGKHRWNTKYALDYLNHNGTLTTLNNK